MAFSSIVLLVSKNGWIGCVGLVGTIFRLKGSISAISFLDCNGILIPTVAEPWTDVSSKDDKKASLPSREFSLYSK